MKNLLASWFRSLTAFESGAVKQEFSIVDPSAAQKDGLNTLVLAVAPSDGNSPTIVSLYFDGSGVKLFEKKYQNDGDAQTEMSAMATDLNEAASLSKEGKVEEARKLAESLFEKYKRHSDPVVNEQPTRTMTQASQEPLVYKGFSIKKLEDGSWQGAMDEIAYRADSIDSLKAKIDNALRKAYGKQLKIAAITQSNWFFDTVDEAMEYQEKMKKLQGPEGSSEGKPLWEQMSNEEVAPSNESAVPEEDNELAPPSLSFDRIEKDKAKTDKDIGKRIKEQVKTEVESALEQKSASVFGPEQEELVEALRKNGRNWDEIKKIFVKELSYNEDDTAVFLDSIRMKEEGGEPVEGLPLPPKPPEDLVSPETHDKLIKEIEDKSEPKPEPLPLADEIARADNTEIRKVAANELPLGSKCPSCGIKQKYTDVGRHKAGCTYAKEQAEKEQSEKKASLQVKALNPLQEPPAVGQNPGQPLSAPVEEAPTFDSPVPPSQDTNPEPEFLEAPKEGDRVYVMGDYETGQDGYEGTFISEYTSRGDKYAVISKDDGDNAEVALHRVVKASQKKVAQLYYEKRASKKCPGCGLYYAGKVPEKCWTCGTNLAESKAEQKEAAKKCPNCGKDIWDTSTVDQRLNKCWNCGTRFDNPEEEPIESEADLEVESKANEDVIRMFVDNSFPKDKMPVWGTPNLKITKYPNGWALVNYQTPILYRANGSDVVVFNTHKYSVTTSKIQNQIRRNFAGQSVKETDESGIQAAINETVWPKGPEDKPTVIDELNETNPYLQSLHESALKLRAELEREGEIAIYFHKEGIEKKAADDSAFEGNGWCRVWIQDDEISSDSRYPAILKLQDETARIDALKDLARELAHEALRLADSAGAKVGVQTWFDSLTPSDHDRIDWVALANPQQEEVESAQNPKIEKKADEPPPAPEVPTQFKHLEKAPARTEREKAQPATEEQAKLVKDVESSLSSLEAIKSLISQAKAKLAEETKAIEERGGRVQIEAELKQKIEHLSKLVEATQNQMVYAGDTMVRLIQETKEKPFKPSDSWKVQKLVEKFAGAQEYLDKAIQGAQSLSTTEQVRDLVFFPRKVSKLHKAAGFLETLDSVYENVLAALKLVIGSEEEQPAAV